MVTSYRTIPHGSKHVLAYIQIYGISANLPQLAYIVFDIAGLSESCNGCSCEEHPSQCGVAVSMLDTVLRLKTVCTVQVIGKKMRRREATTTKLLLTLTLALATGKQGHEETTSHCIILHTRVIQLLLGTDLPHHLVCHQAEFSNSQLVQVTDLLWMLKNKANKPECSHYSCRCYIAATIIVGTTTLGTDS